MLFVWRPSVRAWVKAASDDILSELMKGSPQVLFVGSSGWFEDNPRQIVDLAFKSRLPALYIRREYAEIGGVMSYGINYREMYRTAADYIAGFSEARIRWIFQCRTRRRSTW